MPDLQDGDPPSPSVAARAAGRPRHRAEPPLHVSVTDEMGRAVRMPGLAEWLARTAPRRARGSLTVALVSDRCIRRLNRRYRGDDRVTDVLSFPTGEGRGTGALLGDVVIARGRARAQAREAGHPVAVEYRLLALHGLLHLLGYDHERDDGTMARVERRLRRRGGVQADGVIDRSNGRVSR